MAQIKEITEFMKVVITGPESTGKSRLTEALAKHYKISFVEEYARQYLQETKGKYEAKDLLEIAHGQIKLEDEAKKEAPKFLLCDTGLEVIRIWSEWKYGKCDPTILKEAKERQADLFILLKPDIPWMPDPLRENPDDREELYEQYKKTLAEYKTKVVEVGDYWQQRFHTSIKAIDELLEA